MSDPEERREARDEAFYRAGFAVSAAYVLFGVVLNYGANFAFNEWSYLWLPRIYLGGLGLAPGDLSQPFEVNWLFDGGRGRYLSYLGVILNAKLRILFEQFLPPHPSFSFTWLLTVLLAPYLLFKVMERLSGKRSTAWACAALYLLSPGFLSGITQLGHLGKPLAHFAILLALFLASEARRGWAALAAVLFASCFLDETAWFAAVAAAIYFSAGFPRNWRQAGASLAYFAPLLLYLAMRILSPGGVPFWSAELAKTSRAPLDLAKNSYFLLGSHFVSQSVRDAAIAWAPAAFLAAFILVSWLWSRGVEAARKDLLRRSALALAAYLLFHAVIMTPRPIVAAITHNCFFYGSLTSLFLAMFFSVLLTAQKSPWGRGAAKIFFAAWIVLLCANFGGINHAAKLAQVRASTRGHLADWPGGRGKDGVDGPGFREVLQAWRSRYDHEALARLRREYPQSAYWLFNELDFLAAPDAAELARRRLGPLVRTLTYQGIEADVAGQFEQGRALLLAAVSVGPPAPLAHSELAYLYSLKGDSDRAMEEAQAAVALDPDMTAARNNLGFILLQKERYREAAEQFREILKRDPGHARARNNLAAALSKLGVASPAAQVQAAYDYFLKGDLDRAITATQAAVSLDPNMVDARNNLGFYLLKKERYREAAVQFQEVLARDPQHSRAQNNLKIALAKLGGGDFAARSDAGYRYFLKGDLDRAIEETIAALALDPGRIDARNNLGYYLLQKGRYRESVAQLETVLKLDPQNQLARNNLVLARAKIR